MRQTDNLVCRLVCTRFRYTPTTCFETFPFPEPTDAQRDEIAAAARDLDRLRSAWLNPPECTREEILEFPGSIDGPWKRYVHDPDARGTGTVRYPRTAPRDEDTATQLNKRTLTRLYNDRPTWLDLAHRRLDETVAAAYGWQAELEDEQILEKLLPPQSAAHVKLTRSDPMPADAKTGNLLVGGRNDGGAGPGVRRRVHVLPDCPGNDRASASRPAGVRASSRFCPRR